MRFAGRKPSRVLAPNAKLRSKIVPVPAERPTEISNQDTHAQGETPGMSWARLVKRVFDIDIEHCPKNVQAIQIVSEQKQQAKCKSVIQ